MFCEFCGKEIDNNSEFCVHCGMPVGGDEEPKKQSTSISRQTPQTSAVPYSGPAAAVGSGSTVKGSSGTVLAEGEVIVREYNCANVKGVAGYLTVTNKRLMFNALGGMNSSRYSQEVTLSSVSGFTLHRGTNYNWVLIIIGVLFAILGITTMSASSGYSMIASAGSTTGIIMLVIAAVLLFLGIRPAFQIIVYASNVSPSPIHVGEGPKSIMGNSALYAFVSTPTADTNLMINELGAMVQDLQSMGDLAIEKWQNKVRYSDLPKI